MIIFFITNRAFDSRQLLNLSVNDMHKMTINIKSVSNSLLLTILNVLAKKSTIVSLLNFLSTASSIAQE